VLWDELSAAALNEAVVGTAHARTHRYALLPPKICLTLSYVNLKVFFSITMTILFEAKLEMIIVFNPSLYCIIIKNYFL
jgi:hypothetical protein